MLWLQPCSIPLGWATMLYTDFCASVLSASERSGTPRELMAVSGLTGFWCITDVLSVL